MKWRSIWVILLILPSLVLVGLVAWKKSAPHPQYSSIRRNDPSDRDRIVKSPLLDKWAAQEFVDFTNHVDLRAVIDQLPISSNVSLDPKQKDALLASLTHMVGYYYEGDFENYAAFRFVADTHLTRAMENFCRGQLALPKNLFDEGPKSVLKEYWSKMMARSFAGFWVGLSITNSQIQVQSYTNWTDRAKWMGQMKGVENVGVISITGVLDYVSSPDQLLSREGNVKMATIKLLPKTGDHDVIYPVYVRFYWSPPDQAWLPYQMCSAYSGLPRKRTIWF
jgi:hypothetical protein